jgi:hypothetical protein
MRTKDQASRGIDRVMPENRTRKQHLLAISYKKRNEGEAEATRYWLTWCPRISKKAYDEA